MTKCWRIDLGSYPRPSCRLKPYQNTTLTPSTLSATTSKSKATSGLWVPPGSMSTARETPKSMMPSATTSWPTMPKSEPAIWPSALRPQSWWPTLSTATKSSCGRRKRCHSGSTSAAGGGPRRLEPGSRQTSTGWCQVLNQNGLFIVQKQILPRQL